MVPRAAISSNPVLDSFRVAATGVIVAPDLLRSTRPSDPTSRIGAARRWHSLELPTNRTAWNVMLRRRPKSSVLQSNPYGLPDGRVYPIRAVEEKGLSR